ncbi:MAG: ArsR family transcriptional regulator [Haloarculaceae archaeon]
MSEKGGSQDSADGRAGRAVDDQEGEQRPFIDSVFRVLADWRRREICQFFIETEARTATVDQLGLLLAGCRPAEIDSTADRTHEELTAELEETHLPELDAAGVVDYDERSGTVHYWGQPTVEKWLEHVTEVDRRED